MNDNYIKSRYKKVCLFPKQVEEYEINGDNIVDIQVLVANVDNFQKLRIIFEMSKEAIIGFGVSAIRLKDGLPEKMDIRTEPLGTVCANQPMGFYLTPQSPELFIYNKEFQEHSVEHIKINRVGDDKHNNGHNLSYLVDVEWDNEFIETHNLGFKNVAEIKVYDGEVDITQRCNVIFRFSKSAFLGIGTELIRLANNFEENKRYVIDSMNQLEQKPKLGFYLTKTSPKLEIICKTFKSIFYYDNNFKID